MLDITQRYAKTLSPNGTAPTASPEWIGDIDNPYLHGLYAPVTEEHSTGPLRVEGELPKDLNGAYFRNGPNNRLPPINRYHWFDGDGMVHGLWFDEGEARYANRWVQTKGFLHEQQTNAPVWGGVLGPFDFTLPGGPLKDTANTDLIAMGGRLYALWYESGKLHPIDPRTLAPDATDTISKALPHRISAHSKVDVNTGEFVFFGYGDRPPYMRYGVMKPDGTLHTTDITLAGPRRPHDIGVTPNHSILHDFPVFFDPEVFKATGKRIPLFHKDVPTRYGVIPRFGTDADVRWFEFEPCYMLHVVNCWEEGDEVVMVGCRTPDPSLKPRREDGKLAAMLSGLKLRAHLHEWRMNLETGATSERALSDANEEFPMIRPDVMGHANRYSYLAAIPFEIPATFNALVKADLKTGTSQRFEYGPGVFGSEAPFIPRPGSTEEDDGYVVSFVTDTNDWSSQCLVFDAKDITPGPIARVHIPHRIPAGFHATWMDASEWA